MKGGVGKTAAAVNLSYLAASEGASRVADQLREAVSRTCVQPVVDDVDLDPRAGIEAGLECLLLFVSIEGPDRVVDCTSQVLDFQVSDHVAPHDTGNPHVRQTDTNQLNEG